MSNAYDSDDGPRSPGLEPSKLNYGVEEQPPPFLPQSSVDKGTSPDSSRKNQPNDPGPGVAQGSALLISHIDRNRPDLADHELKHPFRRELTPEDRGDFAATAQGALELLKNEPLVSKDNHQPVKPDSPEVTEPKNGQGPPLPPIVTAKREPISLEQFRIPPSEASTQDLLPALHQAPVFPKSPENQLSLPPIQSALGELPNVPPKDSRVNGVPSYALHPVTGPPPRTDLAREHQFPGHPQAPPSPYSHWSPASSKDVSNVPSPVSQPSYKRPSHKSNIYYVTSPYEVPPQTTKSPATSYPTPSDPPTVGPCERGPMDISTPLNGVTGSFKCDHPGCTAPPFQTQYLLK